MGPFKFRAIVSLDTRQAAPLMGKTACSLTVRVHGGTAGVRFFNARLTTDDDRPLRERDLHHIATLTVMGEDAPRFFAPGHRFELLDGGTVGHGVVTRKVATWPP